VTGFYGQDYDDDGNLVHDPDDPLAPVEKAIAAAGSDDLIPGKVFAAVEAMARHGMDGATRATVRAYLKKRRLMTFAEFDRLVRDCQPAAATHADPDAKSASTLLADLAQERYTFGVTDSGDPFAVPVSGPRVVAMLRGGKTSLRAMLAREYYARTGRAAAQQALADALLVLEGIAQDAEESQLYLRCAQHHGALWLDLGDPAGRAVRVTSRGWTIEDGAPVLFRRTVLTGPLPEPERGGRIGDLWRWLNVAAPDRPLVAAALVAALFSDQPHVVLAIFGEQGTGKTTALKVLTRILDPSPVPVRKPPRDADSWVTAAAGSWVVGLDNLSDIPPWLSDSLCRAVTGDGDVRRKLYSDSDYAVFSFRRCIMFDAIDVGALAPDLADRTVTVTLELIPDSDRLDEETFWAEWAAAHPLLLGALLDLAASVLARLPMVKLARKPRMADFARILAAVDAELGTSGYQRYIGQAAGLAADGLDGDSFARAIKDAIKAPFEGTSGELLKHVMPADQDFKPPKDWPGGSRPVTGRMRRLAPAFRKTGWQVTELEPGHENAIRWRISPAPRTEKPGEDAREDSQGSQPAGSASDASERERSSGTSSHGGEKKSATQPCAKCGGPLDQALIDAGFTDHGEEA
jgi:hypothetical protein